LIQIKRPVRALSRGGTTQLRRLKRSRPPAG
jgi:hypothetical protein